MENQNQDTKKFCTRIRYGNIESPSILLGIVYNKQDGFITFRTDKQEYLISKNSVIAIEPTNIIFRGERW